MEPLDVDVLHFLRKDLCSIVGSCGYGEYNMIMMTSIEVATKNITLGSVSLYVGLKADVGYI